MVEGRITHQAEISLFLYRFYKTECGVEVHMATNYLGWKLLSCSQCQELIKELTWLLIGCLKVEDQSGAKLAL